MINTTNAHNSFILLRWALAATVHALLLAQARAKNAKGGLRICAYIYIYVCRCMYLSLSLYIYIYISCYIVLYHLDTYNLIIYFCKQSRSLLQGKATLCDTSDMF